MKFNEFYVKTRLNGKLTTNFLLDTDASVVVVSETLGCKLEYTNFRAILEGQVKTAGGTV